MRKLKFRIWNNDEMLILDMVKYKYDFENGEVLAFVNDSYREFGAHEFYPTIKADWPVMQFTGSKDGKGNDVYEGDIIGRTSFFDKVVTWHKNGFYTYSVNNPEQLYPLNLDEFDVVVSHIYKNPEVVFSRAVGV